MKIFSKQFINTVLSPNNIPGLSKSERKKICRISAAIRFGSFGIIPLICYIIKKSGCLSAKSSSVKLSNRKVTQTSESSISDLARGKVVPKASSTQTSESSSFTVDLLGKIAIPEHIDIKKREWLTNDHLHNYFYYLGAKYPDVFFMQEAQDELIKSTSIERKISQFDFASSSANAFPFFIQVGGNHWTLVYIDKEKRTVEYFDSMRNYGDLKSIEEQLTNLAGILSIKEPDQEPYQFINKTKTKLQMDTVQCGVWVLYFITKRIKDPDFDCNQIETSEASQIIAKFRAKVRLKLAQAFQAYDEVYKYKLKYYEDKYGKDVGLQKFRKKITKITKNFKKDSLIKIKWLREWHQLKKAKKI